MIQDGFLHGLISVICATTTLSQGVNLPAHLVIVKGTQVYNKNPSGFVEHPSATVLQMIGRAGRPQFDSFGVAVVMTTASMANYYKNILTGLKPIESHLLSGNAVEHINAEIAIQTIGSTEQAVMWLKNTFVSIQMMSSPTQFGISASELQLFDEVLERRMNHNIGLLCEAGMVTISQQTKKISSTKLGLIMAKFYLRLSTAKAIPTINRNVDLSSLVMLVANSAEFLDIPIRQGEKTPLNAANKEGSIRYPITGKVKTLADKISILLQTALNSNEINPFQLNLLNQDLNHAIDISKRILRGAIDYFEGTADNFLAYSNCLILNKALQAKMWTNSPQVLRQIDGIGAKKLSALNNAGITSFTKLQETSVSKLESICERNAPFGLQIKQKVSEYPIMDLRLKKTIVNKDSCKQQVVCRQQNMSFKSTYNVRSFFLLVGLSTGQTLLSRKLNLINGPSSYTFDINVPVFSGEQREIIVHVLQESLAGCDISLRELLSDGLHRTELVDEGPNKGSKKRRTNSIDQQREIMQNHLDISSSKRVRLESAKFAGNAPLQSRFGIDHVYSHTTNCMPRTTTSSLAFVQSKVENDKSLTTPERMPTSLVSNVAFMQPKLGIRSADDTKVNTTRNRRLDEVTNRKAITDCRNGCANRSDGGGAALPPEAPQPTSVYIPSDCPKAVISTHRAANASNQDPTQLWKYPKSASQFLLEKNLHINPTGPLVIEHQRPKLKSTPAPRISLHDRNKSADFGFFSPELMFGSLFEN